MASRLTIGESSESSKLIFLPIGKGDCIIKGFKMESKTSLSPFQCQEVTLQSTASMYEGSYQRNKKQLSKDQ